MRISIVPRFALLDRIGHSLVLLEFYALWGEHLPGVWYYKINKMIRFDWGRIYFKYIYPHTDEGLGMNETPFSITRKIWRKKLKLA